MLSGMFVRVRRERKKNPCFSKADRESHTDVTLLSNWIYEHVRRSARKTPGEGNSNRTVNLC